MDASNDLKLSNDLKFDHIAFETVDVKRLSSFYQELFGFEPFKPPKFRNVDTRSWLNMSPAPLSLHMVERSPHTEFIVSPYGARIMDKKGFSRVHHVCFTVSDIESFVQKLEEKGVENNRTTLPDGKVKQVYFVDPDGNGVEVVCIDP